MNKKSIQDTDITDRIDKGRSVDSIIGNDTYALQPSTLLQGSKYLITDIIGQGGFGITYVGIQTGLNRPVAIKEFYMRDFCSRDNSMTVTYSRPDQTEKILQFKSKFLKEARLIADMSHANIVKIIDVFEEKNTAYYVMEHITGGSVQDLVRKQGALPERKALKIIRQIGDALSHVHQHKILHLDVKPANIMLREDGTAVLIDFGISKHYTDSGNQTTTSLGGISRGYAPLEQYLEDGVAIFSPATDVYSLGATLFYMLMGARPPEAQTIFNEGLPPLPNSISKSTREAITAAMRPQRTERPQNVDAFLSILGGEQAVVNTDMQVRHIIEQLEIQGEYKEAYLRCLDCIDKGVEVEFATKKCEQLIPQVRRKEKKSTDIQYFLVIIGVAITIILFLMYIMF